MTPKQVARWLALGRKAFAQNQAAEQAVAEAKVKADAAAAARAQAAEAKAARIAAVRAGIINSPKVTPGQVAAFLWMPQINLSLRGFGQALAILVQFFAQSLITAGLLSPDHPARSLSGAKSFGLLQLLEEARLNLPPIRVLWQKSTDKSLSRANVAIARQYLTFSSVIGSIVMGSLTVITALAHVIFGSAHAYAQNTSGTALGGGIPLPAAGSDLGSTVIDTIFGTGTSTAASLVSSGLGTMLAMYSNLVLIFAGIIVLWIIISAVAETARTGVPLGKQFNHVWAPIRLVVALGLLVPLGSGLNSGQWIALSLAKWGSSEATKVWSSFANNMITPTGNGQVSSGLTTIPFSNNDTQKFASNLLKVALCKAVNDAVSSNATVNQNIVGVVATPPAITNATPSGTTSTPTNVNPKSQIVWQSASVNCGSLTTVTPTTPTAATTTTTSNGPSTAVLYKVKLIILRLFSTVFIKMKLYRLFRLSSPQLLAPHLMFLVFSANIKQILPILIRTR